MCTPCYTPNAVLAETLAVDLCKTLASSKKCDDPSVFHSVVFQSMKVLYRDSLWHFSERLFLPFTAICCGLKSYLVPLMVTKLHIELHKHNISLLCSDLAAKPAFRK